MTPRRGARVKVLALCASALVAVLAALTGVTPSGAGPAAAGPAAAGPAPGPSDPRAVRRVPDLARPTAGAGYADPVFGTTVRRVSGLSERPCGDGGCPFEVPTYSQLQAFDAGGRLMLLSSSDGYRIRRVSDLREVRILPSAVQLPRWHPRRAALLVHFDRADDAVVTLQRTDAVNGRTRSLHTFGAYASILGDPSFEELSRDGRWLAGLAVRRDGRLEAFSFDLARRRPGAALELGALCGPDPVEPDWVASSPRGRYLVIQWKADGTGRCNGLETYGIATGRFAGRLVAGHQHGDLGLTVGGRELFMTSSDHPDDRNMTGLAWYALPGTRTAAPPHHVRLLDWKAGMDHVSCKGPPGVCLITSGSDPAASCCRAGWQPFQGEVWLQSVEGGGRRRYAPVRRLAHHRSSRQGYWAQPHATLSRDGRYALFGSDWGIRPGRERVDPYIIELRAGARLARSRSPRRRGVIHPILPPGRKRLVSTLATR